MVSAQQGLLPGTGGDAQDRRRQRHAHDKAVFHTLLKRHTEIQREVLEQPDGIRTLTRSGAPELVALIQEHALAMHQRLREGMGLRFWDPAFREIFAAREQVHMSIQLLPDGVAVEETSADTNVVKLIQAHGRGVSAFVREGFAAAARATPLPDDYRRLAGTDAWKGQS
jgi:hypothetical protein